MHPPVALLAVIAGTLTAVTFCYLAMCAARPWGACWRCRPGGRNRTCRACNGTGIRPRVAWRLLAHLRRLP